MDGATIYAWSPSWPAADQRSKVCIQNKSEYSLEKILWKLKQTKHETQMQMCRYWLKGKDTRTKFVFKYLDWQKSIINDLRNLWKQFIESEIRFLILQPHRYPEFNFSQSIELKKYQITLQDFVMYKLSQLLELLLVL